MAYESYRRGGSNVAVGDGGTNADDAATARTNLGAGTSNYTQGAHDVQSHAGVPGVGGKAASFTLASAGYNVPAGPGNQKFTLGLSGSGTANLAIVMDRPGTIVGIACKRESHTGANLILAIQVNGATQNTDWNEAPGTANAFRNVSVGFSAGDDIGIEGQCSGNYLANATLFVHFA